MHNHYKRVEHEVEARKMAAAAAAAASGGGGGAPSAEQQADLLFPPIPNLPHELEQAYRVNLMARPDFGVSACPVPGQFDGKARL